MGLNIVTEVCSDVVHWIFAMKYWSLACKMELINRNEDPDKHNSLYMAIFVAGIVLNTVAGLVMSINPTFLDKDNQKVVSIITAVLVLPLIVSCLFLADAFRRFKNIKKADQVINKKQVFALSCAFGSFTFGIILFQLEILIPGG